MLSVSFALGANIHKGSLMTFPFDAVDPKPGDMPNARVVLLNGPPGCGKDTGGKALIEPPHYQRVPVMGKFAKILKESVHADFGYPELHHDYFEHCKNMPLPMFRGKSPRDAYIYKSEKVMKPHYGEDFYGRMWLREALNLYISGYDLFFITDSGFASEVQSLIEVIGPASILHVKIDASSRGCTFEGDSRSYLELPGIESVTVKSDTIEQYRFDLRAAVYGWVSR